VSPHSPIHAIPEQWLVL